MHQQKNIERWTRTQNVDFSKQRLSLQFWIYSVDILSAPRPVYWQNKYNVYYQKKHNAYDIRCNVCYYTEIISILLSCWQGKPDRSAVKASCTFDE